MVVSKVNDLFLKLRVKIWFSDNSDVSSVVIYKIFGVIGVRMLVLGLILKGISMIIIKKNVSLRLKFLFVCIVSCRLCSNSVIIEMFCCWFECCWLVE